MKKLLLLGVMAFTGASSAFAADLTPAYKAPPAPMPQPWSWTGFYFGGHVGAGIGQNDWGNLSTVADSTAAPGIPGGNGTIMGALGGLQAGYNYQVGWAVFGVEGDWSWSGLKGHTNGHPADLVGDQAVDNPWIATVTGRVGGLVGQNTLVYLKGGGAWARLNYNINAFSDATFEGAYPQVSDNRFGWTFGFGTEYHFDQHWSALIEADYLDFGTKTISFPQGNSSYAPYTAPFTANISQMILAVC